MYPRLMVLYEHANENDNDIIWNHPALPTEYLSGPPDSHLLIRPSLTDMMTSNWKRCFSAAPGESDLTYF
jgi:hypothetical protein